MELKQLQLLVAVADDLHFRRAAERMFIAQPALSQHIRRLEREVGARLLDRSARHVRLTPAGEAFVPLARRMLDDAREAVQVARHAEEGRTESIAVAAVSPLTTSLLPCAVRAWSAAHPEARATMTEARIADVVSLVRHRTIDVAVVDDEFVHPALTATRLRNAAVGILLPRDHPLVDRQIVELEQIVDLDFVQEIGRNDRPSRRNLLAAFSRTGVDPHVVAEVAHPVLVPAAVSAGVGVALVIDEWLHAGLGADVVWRPVRGLPSVPVSAVLVAEKPPVRAQQFVEVLEIAGRRGDPVRASTLPTDPTAFGARAAHPLVRAAERSLTWAAAGS